MKPEDFYDLKIGQEIYYYGAVTYIVEWKTLLRNLGGNAEKYIKLSNVNNNDELLWDSICSDCSLTPPKQKKKYWRWKIGENTGWYCHDHYLDESGLSTGGWRYINFWDDKQKIKVEDDFVEVDV